MKALLLALFLVTPTWAQPPVFMVNPHNHLLIDGHQFSATCFSHEKLMQAACAGFIGGTVNAYLTTNNFCVPPTVSPAQVVTIVVDYLRAHSYISSQIGTYQVMWAMRKNFPCY